MDKLDSDVLVKTFKSSEFYYMILQDGKVIKISYGEYLDINNTNQRIQNRYLNPNKSK